MSCSTISGAQVPSKYLLRQVRLKDDAFRFVQIGTTSAPDITLPGAVLRSSTIQIMGSGIGSIPLEEIILILSKLMQATSEVGFQMETRELPLSGIAEAWSSENATPRIVLTMNAP